MTSPGSSVPCAACAASRTGRAPWRPAGVATGSPGPSTGDRLIRPRIHASGPPGSGCAPPGCPHFSTGPCTSQPISPPPILGMATSRLHALRSPGIWRSTHLHRGGRARCPAPSATPRRALPGPSRLRLPAGPRSRPTRGVHGGRHLPSRRADPVPARGQLAEGSLRRGVGAAGLEDVGEHQNPLQPAALGRVPRGRAVGTGDPHQLRLLPGAGTQETAWHADSPAFCGDAAGHVPPGARTSARRRVDGRLLARPVRRVPGTERSRHPFYVHKWAGPARLCRPGPRLFNGSEDRDPAPASPAANSSTVRLEASKASRRREARAAAGPSPGAIPDRRAGPLSPACRGTTWPTWRGSVCSRPSR
jgi:hypothetical protein